MTETGQNQTRLTPKAGDEDFAVFRENGIYYVDKTQYLKPLFLDTDSRFLLLRPRRFGKTLTMSMLRHFLEMDYQNPGDTSRQQELFRGLKVTEDQKFCEEHMGRYPVVSVSLKSADGVAYDDAFERLAGVISRLAENFSWLDGPELTEKEHVFLDRLSDFDYLRQPAGRGFAEQSLIFLCHLLRKRFGDSRKPVLLIDEYDVPLQKAAIGGYYEPMSKVIGALLGDALKTNEDISKVIMTGCLRATKEGIFTGLNNLELDTVLTEASDLRAAIGFTPDEVRTMLEYYRLGNLYEKARSWYDGYSIGGQDLFCPWDVTKYVKELCRSKAPAAVTPKSYWNNTSNVNIVTEFMPHLAPKDSDRMQELVAGRSVAVNVDEGMSYGTLRLNNLSSEQLWNILLYTGYLTLDEHCDNGINRLRIPNREVLKCFRDNISKYYEGKGESPYGILARNLIGQLFSCDSDNAAESLQSLLAGFVSLRDNATRAPHENFYHGFLDGLFAAAGDDIRDYKSQAESGSGYADITFKSRSRTEAVVIEIKYAKDSSTDLTALANSALAQIEEKGYAKSLLCNPKIKRVVECGIAFHGRDCDVSCGELLP